jgi:Rieske Fe-S protein
MKRKEFVKKTGAAALLLSMGILLESCNDDSSEMMPDNTDDNNVKIISFDKTASPFDVLQNNDGWLLHPSENILLVNVGGVIRALTSVCTHSGCNDDWTYNSQSFTCNCHGSIFSNKGEVTRGPATSNLKEYKVEVEGDTVNISVS